VNKEEEDFLVMEN